jgi:hypothetical protein
MSCWLFCKLRNGCISSGRFAAALLFVAPPPAAAEGLTHALALLLLLALLLVRSGICCSLRGLLGCLLLLAGLRSSDMRRAVSMSDALELNTLQDSLQTKSK